MATTTDSSLPCGTVILLRIASPSPSAIAAGKMQEGSNPAVPPPHVLIFPLPAQGHVNSMLKLAELLCLAGLNVTFLNSEHNHKRLLNFTDIQARFQKYPGFQFKTITDGLPVEDTRAEASHLMDMLRLMKLITKPIFKEMLLQAIPPVNCVIADGILGFACDAATEVGIPVIPFRTIGACCFWIYFSILDSIEAGELPIKGNEDMDRLITKVSGTETFLRCRDLPSFCRVSDMTDLILQLVLNETRQSTRAHALIFNTFEELEGPLLFQIRTKCRKVYTIGPLHEHLKYKLSTETQEDSYQSSNSLFKVDRSCIEWLDNQSPRSVLYVSFGSLTTMKRDQLMEFWYGLVNSKKRFLWVVRPESVAKKDGETEEEIPLELVEGTNKGGRIVGWAPQEEVLAHNAVGGFLTHSGWNSTLESIVAGVPMICWPVFADQQVNSRFVSEVWKLGLDMKDVCDRRIVENMVNDLMVHRKDEFAGSTARMANLARNAVAAGGSSSYNLDCLINEIRSMTLTAPDHAY